MPQAEVGDIAYHGSTVLDVSRQQSRSCYRVLLRPLTTFWMLSRLPNGLPVLAEGRFPVLHRRKRFGFHFGFPINQKVSP